jgi:hypothetical protein
MKRLCADDVTDSMPLFRSGGGGAIPTSALQLEIGRCNVHRAIELNALWHSRLPKVHWSNIVRSPPHICFVAEVDAIAYASAIWSAPCARLLNGRGWLELRRMAIGDNAPKNTASRMLKIMRLMIRKDLPDIVRLISYQDTDVHNGTIYNAAGWKPIETFKSGNNWNTNARKRDPQTSGKDGRASVKIRWEYQLQPEPKQ